MQIGSQVLSFFLGAGIIQGLFCAFILFKRKSEHKQADRYLALLLVLFSISILHTIILKNHNNEYTTKLGSFREPFQFLFGPLLLFYAKKLLNPQQMIKLISKQSIHFIPFLVYIIFLLIFPLFQFTPKTYQFVLRISWIFILIHYSIYLYLLFRLLGKHKSLLKEYYSEIVSKSLRWLKILAILFCFMYITLILLFSALIHQHNQLLIDQLSALFLSFSVYSLAYKGLQYKHISFDINKIKLNKVNTSKNKDKYHKSGLNKLEASRIADNLQLLLKNKKPYLDPDINLQNLSVMLDVSRNTLSEVINTVIGMSFFDYIAMYRVQEIKSLIIDPANNSCTFLELAFKAGFNSKPAFNSAFKKMTGITPSQFKKNQFKELI